MAHDPECVRRLDDPRTEVPVQFPKRREETVAVRPTPDRDVTLWRYLCTGHDCLLVYPKGRLYKTLEHPRKPGDPEIEYSHGLCEDCLKQVLMAQDEKDRLAAEALG